MAGTIEVTLKVENTYSDETVVNTCTGRVPRPDDLDDLDEWFEDYIFEFTGTGAHRSRDYAIYEVEVAGCTDEPALVGRTYGWGG